MYSMQTCKGIVQSGPRKGLNCIPKQSVDSDGYCIQHQRYKEYLKLVESGKKPCSQFFRGCNTICDDSIITCKDCREQKNGKGKSLCNHDSCKNYAGTNAKYCGKHHRDMYRDYEKEHGVKLCNIDRGCFNRCDTGEPCCKSCMVKHYITNDKYFRPDVIFELCIQCESPISSGDIGRSVKQCDSCINLFISQYKSHSANVHKDYKAFKLDNPQKHFNEVKQGANCRNLSFELSQEYFSELVHKDCFYCKRPISLGIDRLDNTKGYTIENSVSCCFPCNRMKHTLSIAKFVNKCYAIYNYTTLTKSFGNELHSIFPEFISKACESYDDYSKKACKRHTFEISSEQYSILRKGMCYLCGASNTAIHNNGIDRKHNQVGYIITNCNTCCGSCNLLKANIPIGIIKDCIMRIVANPSLKHYVLLKDMLQITAMPKNHTTPNKNEHVIGAPKVILSSPTPQRPSTHFSIPKQWKPRDIFDFLNADQEHHYKQHCEENNTLTPEWPTMWSEFLTLKGQPWEIAEPRIRDFVENLRRLRHNALTKKDVLDREDRQVWPAETVAALFLAGRIAEYKTITETATGDDPMDPKWQKRWEEFVGSLETCKEDKAALTKSISKFMTAQRAKKYRRNAK